MACVKVETELRWLNAKNSPQLVFTDRNKHVRRKRFGVQSKETQQRLETPKVRCIFFHAPDFQKNFLWPQVLE
jgi:hypothetical protein